MKTNMAQKNKTLLLNFKTFLKRAFWFPDVRVGMSSPTDTKLIYHDKDRMKF